ncbi:MAG TPA: hypothetical protein VF759_01060 [Allosphingosinicella sp.]|jgi:hypothetical protein
MRDPARKAAYFLLAALAGAGLVWFGAVREQRIGEHWTAIVPLLAGFTVAPIALVLAIQALFAARGKARLLAGRRVIARWRVHPAEWESFRALDMRRRGGDPGLVNDLRIRKSTPPEGVEVIVGETGLLVDGSYHGLSPRGLPELREARWLEGPPACLEFALLYPRSRYGGTVPTTLRVPVPAGARGSAQRILDHFRPRLARKPGLALRNPPKTYRICAALFAAGVAMAAIGYSAALEGAGGSDPLVPAALLIAGIGLGAFALLLAAAVWLVTRPG